jgi:tetratricopeptide (TPR) repeat protein
VSPEVAVWTPALVSLSLGLAAGGALAWILRRHGEADRRREDASLPVEVRDLAEKETTLLAQLEELDDTAGKYLPAEHARLRGALEREAAATLKAYEASLLAARRREAHLPGERSRGSAGQPRPATALRGFLWGAGSVAALALLLLLASQSTAPRAPRGSLTGAIDRPGAPDSAAGGADALRARVRAHPDDIEARLELTRLAVSGEDWTGVLEQTRRILELSPDNPEALSFQGLARFAMGQPQEAIALLQRAQAAAPDVIDPYALLSLVYARTGRMDLAEATMAQAAERFPDRRPMLAQMLAQLRAQAGGESGPAAGESPAAPLAGASSAAPPLAGRGVAGTVDLAAEVRGREPRGAVLFLIARPAGSTGGPPTAVQRLSPSAFPLSFVLDDSSSMLGQPLPARLRLEARLDADGDPLTRSPSDLHAELDDVAAGTSGLRLVLRP